MTTSHERFIDTLGHIEADIRTLQARQTDLKTALGRCEERLVLLEQSRAALRLLVSDTEGEETAPSAPTGSGDPPPSGDDPLPARKKPTADKGKKLVNAPLSLCDRIQRLLDSQPGRAFRPREVAEILGSGEDVDKFRSLLKYVFSRGRIRKNPDATYQSLAFPQIAAFFQAAPETPQIEAGASAKSATPTTGRKPTRRPRSGKESIDAAQVLAFLRESADRCFRPHQIADQLAILDQEALRLLLKEQVSLGTVAARSSGRYQYALPSGASGRSA